MSLVEDVSTGWPYAVRIHLIFVSYCGPPLFFNLTLVVCRRWEFYKRGMGLGPCGRDSLHNAKTKEGDGTRSVMFDFTL